MKIENYCFILLLCLINTQTGIAFTESVFFRRHTRLSQRTNFQSLRKSKQLYMGDDDDFWSQQKTLMEEMTGKAEDSFRQEQRDKFAERRSALLGDTAFFTSLLFSFLWLICDNPFISFSYVFGAIFGLAYTYGLGRYVETIGGSVDDTEAIQGAGVGQARFAFLILLFIFVGKLRSFGLEPIPSILGFFTYQIASLSQGLREIND